MRLGSISVVIPVFNAARYLKEAIESARDQTRAPLEIIAVDDGSTDDSVAVAEAAGARVIRMSANHGPSAARNTGIRESVGDYVAMLDADDAWEPFHCETVARLLDLHPEAALGASRARLLAPASRDTTIPVAGDTPLDVLVPMLGGNLVAQTTVIARRDALLAAGGYDARLRYAEDYDLWLRLARTHPFVFSHRVTARYRVHAHQASKNTAGLAASAWTVRHPHFAHLAQRGDPAATRAGEEALRRALSNELVWAFDVGDRRAMEAVIDAGSWVPGADEIVARWTPRLGRAWPFWRLATALRAAARNVVHRPLTLGRAR